MKAAAAAATGVNVKESGNEHINYYRKTMNNKEGVIIIALHVLP